MNKTRLLIALLWALTATLTGFAQEMSEDEELPVIPYFQSYAFNVPVLEGWENQSTENIAQFYLADASATIRTNIVYQSDAVIAAQQDLEAFFGQDIPEPIYNERVNLADGTWAVLVYRIDDATTASAMSRVDDGRSFVVSFIEANPDVEVIMTTIAHADEAQEDPTAEIITAVETFTSASPDNLSDPEDMTLPSGEWIIQSTDNVTAMGWVFGNDSYLAISEGDIDNLPTLANAFNSTFLGFFTTPDNSNYLALGIAVSIGTLAILLLSIVWRSRGLNKDLAVIQQLSDDDN